ncbi:NAD(P)H-dependent oxidoreductase [Novosphingobium flavum]|uniref:FMN dependent NADH:quinone oxidoreductase n=1 Tax=Novosphingobium aerophilum TaxID=2839843 RepID=A0A7X1F4G5_9SPHN|nr:NAD(P)H-dependent oxidoreductase [Novosphingobium aerophilum]MBC2650079.1 NAD(P)H-dependent oxidoreductase [Novosphingobium aerophilum]MBC2661882.1 NAD(P)H-dependent oxidoreductase [Novosphingobium aerophilum]
MTRLLHISASPRGDRSRSDKVARRLIAGLGAAEVETLDLAAATLPAFDGAAIEGRYDLIEGRAVDPAVIAAWEGIRATVAHFLSFDTHVFSVPMWNFGVPWRLKQYIDVLTQPGLAFTVSAEGVTGLAAGRRAVLVCSGALDIRPGQPGAELDFQTAYMRAWLGFIGVTDVHELQVRPTYGSPEEVEAAMERAYAEADALAGLLRG